MVFGFRFLGKKRTLMTLGPNDDETSLLLLQSLSSSTIRPQWYMNHFVLLIL